MSNALPYTLNNLAGAATRVLLAPMDSAPALPAKASDIYGQKDPYTAVSPWFNVGATAGPTVVGRNLATSGFNIEQSLTTLLEEPTELTYTVQVPFAELSAQTLSVISQGVTTSVAAGANDIAATKTAFGQVFQLEHYRIAMVARRNKDQGVVHETSTSLTRGRYLTFVGYDCSMQAENTNSSWAKGTLASWQCTFKLYPDSAITAEGQEYGFWLDEAAGTIA